jgi:hypothetical protein
MVGAFDAGIAPTWLDNLPFWQLILSAAET